VNDVEIDLTRPTRRRQLLALVPAAFAGPLTTLTTLTAAAAAPTNEGRIALVIGNGADL
jgi:hypothetical protein